MPEVQKNLAAISMVVGIVSLVTGFALLKAALGFIVFGFSAVALAIFGAKK